MLTAILSVGPARAASVPLITAGPVINGTPQAGETLTATATWQGDPAPTPAWTWLRCPRGTGQCDVILRATAVSYTPTPADVGAVLRVRLRVTNADGFDDERSGPTAVVAAAATPTPTPTPLPTPTASPTATPTATPTTTTTPPTVVSSSPSPSPSPSIAPAAIASPLASPAPAPRRLRPFPVVRIKGVLTAHGARVTLLSVRAPRGSSVTVVCRGRDCPTRRFTAPASTGRLRPFERALSAGTRLEVRVTKPGFIGKSTVIVIRRLAAPKRTDRCLPPGAQRPARCPPA